MISKNKISPADVRKVLYENRYRNQEGSSILVCGGKDKKGKVTNEVLELEIPSFNVKKFPSMVEPHLHLDLATMNTEVIAFVKRIDLGERLDDSVGFVEIYSDKTKTWTHQYINTKEKSFYCVCSFMGKLYLIGGWRKKKSQFVSYL